ncbi:MAG: COR domain-containing protein, partial [Planctomycetota bacterium]
WEPSVTVTKIVIGTPPSDDEKEIAVGIPDHLSELYPNLTHLHLWQIGDLEQLPELPRGLVCLDVRGCAKLNGWGGVPTELPQLETLVLDGCRDLPAPKMTRFPALRDLSVRNCTAIDEVWLQTVLHANDLLHSLDASECEWLTSLPMLPAALVDLRLNGCRGLTSILDDHHRWPKNLRRLELRHAQSLLSIPNLPESLDYVDLAYTSSLKVVPVMPKRALDAPDRRRPRTLFLFETGVPLDRDLYGETEDTNVAERVLADMEASEASGRQTDHELKVILLGNGRCGKSSFARKWIHDEFREDEKSTHGIRLWEKDFQFTPVDETAPATAQLNIWDFAGQDLYHSTHRLFLQSRAIFILFYTDHPPGADAETDRREEAAIGREGEDVHREPQYWIDQVKSLGKIPGTGQEPPLLIVRSKSDRDHERDIDDRSKAIYSPIELSAKTGAGIDEIKRWLQGQVRELLGPYDARSLPASAMQVKDALQPMIEENRERYWELDEEGKPFQSPHPTIGRPAFDDLVKVRCAGAYAEKPELLLERFHRSGYLYYNEEYLRDDVILDQRWAIHGIYAFSSRQSEFNIRERLRDANGQFTKEELARYSWTPAGYDAKAQHLFMRFMLSCGMCFELLRDNESASGQIVYAAPGFFPSRAVAAQRFSELNAPQTGTWAQYRLPTASEADVRSLIADIGTDWSRSMQTWRWGCRLASARTGALCWIDWARSDDSQEYVSPLDVWFSGPQDRPFEHHVRERVQRHLNHPRYDDEHPFDSEWPSIAEHALQKQRLPFRADGGAPAGDESPMEEVRPTRDQAVGVRVTFSFAGSDAEHGLVGEIPSQLGKKLHDQLKGDTRNEVLCYDHPEGDERLSEFMKKLAGGDLILIFWSKKYWYSPYCMTEMMLIYEEPPEGRLPDKQVLVFVFEDQRLSNDGPINATAWDREWKTRVNARLKHALEDSDEDARELHRIFALDGVVRRWYELVARFEEFDPFRQLLVGYRHGRPLSIPENKEEAGRVADELLTLVNQQLKQSN